MKTQGKATYSGKAAGLVETEIGRGGWPVATDQPSLPGQDAPDTTRHLLMDGAAVDIKDVRRILRNLPRTSTAGELCKQLGVSPQYYSDVMLGRRMPEPKLLKAIGLIKVVTYEPMPEPVGEKNRQTCRV